MAPAGQSGTLFVRPAYAREINERENFLIRAAAEALGEDPQSQIEEVA